MEVDEYLFKEGTWVLNNNIELKGKSEILYIMEPSGCLIRR